ncbi:hypothetical protein [Acidithiobacillus sp.]
MSNVGSGPARYVAQAKAYDQDVSGFNSGRLVWVARYFLYQHGQLTYKHFNEAAHLAQQLVTGQNGVSPAGWSSLVVGNAMYSPGAPVGNHLQVAYQWIGPKPVDTPSILPVSFSYLWQPMKDEKRTFFHVTTKMYLALVEYHIHKGFDISSWIHKHAQQLQGWMVIYHQGDKAVVRKSGQTLAYPQPVMIKADSR